jgi:predicted lipid-binding transport protein (Tim44 family)
MIEIAVLALVAGFVLFRLYTTLGKRTGSERPIDPQPQTAQGPLPRGETALKTPLAKAPIIAGAEGLQAISRADNKFDADHFVAGARAAYEMIVGAFGKGDKEALRPLLTPRVFETYVSAIDARVAKNELGPELVRLRTAEIADADLTDSLAHIVIKFEAELAEGAHGVRDAHEKWTFERDVRSPDPNWRLSRVTAA